MCHQLLPSNFRSYGATPIKGDSESFRPYYRLVIILDTLMSSVITLLHPVTLTLVGRRIFIVNSCQNFTYPGYSKVARGLCIKRHWIIVRKWFNISFYNFGRSMLIQCWRIELELKVFKWTFSNRHFLNTYYLKADGKGYFKMFPIISFPSDLPCTALNLAEYLFDVNCWIFYKVQVSSCWYLAPSGQW